MMVKIEQLFVLNPSQIETAWDFYEGVFSPLRVKTPLRQNLTQREFYQVCSNSSIQKFLCREREIVAFGMMTNILSTVSWINPEYFQARYPEEYQLKKVHYIMALAAQREKLGVGRLLLCEMIATIPTGSVGIFDCMEANKGIITLTRKAGAARGMKVEGPQILDTQTFIAFKRLK